MEEECLRATRTPTAGCARHRKAEATASKGQAILSRAAISECLNDLLYTWQDFSSDRTHNNLAAEVEEDTCCALGNQLINIFNISSSFFTV